MSLPKLWSGRRIAALSGLALIGALQAVAGLCVATSASGLMLGDFGTVTQVDLALLVGAGTATLIVLRVVERRWAEAFALGYVTSLRTAFMSHVLRQPIDSAGTRLGLIMTRVVNDLSAIRLWLSRGIVSIIVAITVFLTITTYFVLTNPFLAQALAGATLIWLFFVSVLLYPLFVSIRLSRKLRGRLANNAAAILKARPSLLLHGRHGKTMRAFRRQAIRLNKALVGRATWSGGLRASPDLVFPALAFGLTLGFPYMEASGAALSTADFAVLIMATGLLTVQLNALALSAEYKMASDIALDRLQSVMHGETFALTGEAPPIKRVSGGVSLRAKDLPIGDRCVTIFADAGEHVLISGLTETENLALSRQIARVGSGGSGRLHINGLSATDMSRRDWWRLVTLVSEDLPLVRGSVLENVCLGAPSKVTDREVRAVLDAFGLGAEIDLMIDPEHIRPPTRTASAIRACRAILRHAALVVVQDCDLPKDAVLLQKLSALLRERGTTVVYLIEAGETKINMDRVVEITGDLNSEPIRARSECG